ncbi:zinc finger protein 488 [Eptesicus fuscus]|uniref:zinc finger protein 488 n=1 Tax=Eptesicus fuscus TaxID=29078 RepID=UPI0024047137|nr:zinc finger protein 488 [Eptesicus fuscus]
MPAGKGVLQTRGCKPVLLEQTKNPGSKAALSGGGQQEAGAELALPTPSGELRLGKALAQTVHWEPEQSTFMGMPHLKKRLQGMWAKEREHDDFTGQPGPRQRTQGIPREAAGSTVFSAWPSRAGREQRSAFRKPARCPPGRPRSASPFPAGRPADARGELLGPIQIADIPCWARLFNSKVSVSDFWSLQMLPQNAAHSNAVVAAPTLWLTHAMAQIPTASSSSSVSWALLPSAFTSLGLSSQNWCAKCNLSFRLTSDLVSHMRSHHRKEHAGPDLHSGKLREEALACPLCREYFRERHHLSRHMTSHR